MKPWPKVRLGEVLTPADRGEAPLPGTSYRQIGVKLWGEGAYERETMDGSATKYAQLFRAEAGDVIVNKIWARNGSVAVVPESLAGCFGSSEFPMFAPKRDRLESRWMHWLTKTRGFWAQCDEKSRGTSGKNRIKPEQFLSVEIPLPPLTEQRRVVARIEELAAQIHEARILRHQAAEEAEALPRKTADQLLDSELAPRVPLRELLSEPLMNGLSVPASRLGSGNCFAKVGVVNSGVFNAGETKLVDLDLAPDSPYWLRNGDIVVSRGNSPEFVGRAAVYEGKPAKCAMPDLLIRVRLDSKKADTRFVSAFSTHPKRANTLQRKSAARVQQCQRFRNRSWRHCPFPFRHWPSNAGSWPSWTRCKRRWTR